MRLSQVYNFIKKERLYVLLLIFIASVNIALFLTGEKVKPTYRTKEIKSVFHKKEFTKGELAELLRTNKPLGTIVSVFSVAALFAVGAGLFLDFIILVLKRDKAALLFPAIPYKEPRWGIWDVCKVIILFLWFGYMLVFIEEALSGLFPAIKSPNLRSVLNATITDLLAFVFIIYFVAREYKERISALGLSAKNFLRNIFYGVFGYLAAAPALIAALLLIIWISALFKYEPPMQPVLEIFLEEKKRGLIIYLTVFAAVFGPIAEETFFRGFLYKALKRRIGFKAALLSTSAIFAALHANLAGFLPIMILGMLLCYLFEKTGTLVASCAVHILHNTIMIVFVFLFKGLLRLL